MSHTAPSDLPNIDLEIQSADPNAGLSSEDLLGSDTHWEMQEEAELSASLELQRCREHRQGHYIGLDWF